MIPDLCFQLPVAYSLLPVFRFVFALPIALLSEQRVFRKTPFRPEDRAPERTWSRFQRRPVCLLSSGNGSVVQGCL